MKAYNTIPPIKIAVIDPQRLVNSIGNFTHIIYGTDQQGLAYYRTEIYDDVNIIRIKITPLTI